MRIAWPAGTISLYDIIALKDPALSEGDQRRIGGQASKEAIPAFIKSDTATYREAALKGGAL
jgi:hypothetical protein